MRILPAIFVCVLSVLNASAQISLNGKITDEDGQPIAFATITLSGGNIKSVAVLADSLGVFRFQHIIAGQYQAQFSHINYIQQQFLLSAFHDTIVKVIMRPKASQLKEVKVTGNKPLFERKIDRFVFNVENSLAAERGDALDVLSVTPAVSVQNESVGIAGKGGVSFMINGKMVQFSGTDLVSYLRAIPSDAIEKIEVITSPPAQYSAEGNSGIINIVLKKNRSDFWSSTLRSSYSQSTYPTGTAGVNFDYKKQQLSLSAGANYTNGSNAAIERPLVEYTDQTWYGYSSRRDYSENYNARLLADYDISSRWNIGTQVFYSRSMPHSVDNSITNITSAGSTRIDSMLFGSGRSTRDGYNLSVNANTTYKLDSNGARLMLDFDYYSSERDNDRIFTSNSYDSAYHFFRGSNWYSSNLGQNTFDNYSINLDIAHRIGSLNVNYGARYLASRSVNNLNSYASLADTNILFRNNDQFVFDESTGAVFASADKSLTEKIEARIGLRAELTHTKGVSNTLQETYRNDYFNLFPTFYISYRHDDNNTFSFNYGRRIERPSYQSLNPFARYINRNYYSVGNPFLLPSFVNNLEFNYDHKDFLGVSSYLSFSSNVAAQIAIPDAITKLVVDTMQNSYDAFNAGVNIFYIFKKIKWLESINQLTVFYQNIDQKVAFLPQKENGVAFSFNMDNTIKISRNLSAQAGIWYAAPQFMGIYKQSDRYNLTGGLRWKLWKSKASLSLTVNDMLKRSQARLSSTVGGVIQHYNNYYDSRYFRVAFQYKFGNQKINTKQRDFRNEDEKQRSR
ncbi:TonB-dependent receptor [Chitinophaga oryziterrae]|uniref:TonB-dependent receptor n=1 Tax=Chitinophaga oryziterrae TaxID=1031224 RepID=A0A6N8JDA2_9BACT|nr:TonB-dependent receptor [Chitinophaga oryziterrae]MVT43305.1 TonB-dependent receptor [Chitinophaga oryziterrae]